MGPPWRLPNFAIGLRFWHRFERGDIPRQLRQKFYSQSHDVVIRIYDQARNAIGAHEQAGDFREL